MQVCTQAMSSVVRWKKRASSSSAASSTARSSTQTAPAAEGEEVEEGVDGAEGGEGGEETADEMVVQLNPLTPNGQPIVINAPDAETFEALQRLQNGYMRGEQARAVSSEAREVIDEFEEFREGLRLDPLTTIESALTVDQAEMLVRSLVTHPALFQRLAADLEAIASGDEDAVQRLRERAESARHKLRDSARTELESQRAIKQNARDIQSVVGRLVPEGFTDEQREFFYRDARYDIQEWQARTGQSMVPPNMVAQILAPRLKLYGVDLAARRGRPGRAPNAPNAPAAAAAPAGAASGASSARPVERVQANAQRRQMVAAAAPGAQSVGRADPLGAIPKDADLKSAIATVRSLRRVG